MDDKKFKQELNNIKIQNGLEELDFRIYKSKIYFNNIIKNIRGFNGFLIGVVIIYLIPILLFLSIVASDYINLTYGNIPTDFEVYIIVVELIHSLTKVISVFSYFFCGYYVIKVLWNLYFFLKYSLPLLKLIRGIQKCQMNNKNKNK